MDISLLDVIRDPAFRAPIIGSVIVGVSAGLLGSIVLLRRQSLLGETISHACFPGIILGSILSQVLLFEEAGLGSYLLISLLGIFFALIAQKLLLYLVEVRKVKEDSALLIVLSGFFGWGVLLSSYLQFEYPSQYKLALTYLYGQAATLTDVHFAIYTCFLAFTAVLLFFFSHVLEIKVFNREYFLSLYGNYAVWFQRLIWILVISVIVLGVRSLGVVLMSALLITPALTARLLFQKFSLILLFSSIFGAFSALIGNLFSLYGTLYLSSQGYSYSLPSGPSIVLASFLFCLMAILFSPHNGLVIRLIRIVLFRMQTLQENILKAIWREPKREVDLLLIAAKMRLPKLFVYCVLLFMERKRWIYRKGEAILLSETGLMQAQRIVRLHRLWELYLVECVNIGKERVHISAEEMEHVLTPEIEQMLTSILNDPQIDPHKSPIPPPHWKEVH